ncbi:hypothetical protein BH09SUM1_BH09SUM1_02130 [soil metagenome]
MPGRRRGGPLSGDVVGDFRSNDARESGHVPLAFPERAGSNSFLRLDAVNAKLDHSGKLFISQGFADAERGRIRMSTDAVEIRGTRKNISCSRFSLSIGIIAGCLFATICALAQNSDLTNFMNGYKQDIDDRSKGTVRINSRIVDQEGRPIDNVDIQVGTSTFMNMNLVTEDEELNISRILNRDWTGIMSLDLVFYKDGYRSAHLQFSKGNNLPNQASGAVVNGVMIHEEDVVMYKRSRNSGSPISTEGTTVASFSYNLDGSSSFLAHPELGSRGENFHESADNEILADPTVSYIRLGFVSALGIERVSAGSPGDLTFFSAENLQLVVKLYHAADGDGFVEALPKDHPGRGYYPDDLTTAPEEGYSDELRIPTDAFRNPEPYHYFYFKINGHFGKGAYSEAEYTSSSDKPPSARLNIQMVSNPVSGEQNIMTKQEPF